ncbi:hypothetical protein ALTERO38_51993 [Alteromonas sp. 38]|nr:hypothetical protein ALTER154_50236 [Alteromonas sp. 154]VXB95143.1 hypothetical protein ALTERO38_51993 [Alteromonas sp. 38]
MEDSAMLLKQSSAKNAEKSGAVIFIVIPFKVRRVSKLRVKAPFISTSSLCELQCE